MLGSGRLAIGAVTSDEPKNRPAVEYGCVKAGVGDGI
jgi:hypothetical protein